MKPSVVRGGERYGRNAGRTGFWEVRLVSDTCQKGDFLLPSILPSPVSLPNSSVCNFRQRDASEIKVGLVLYECWASMLVPGLLAYPFTWYAIRLGVK